MNVLSYICYWKKAAAMVLLIGASAIAALSLVLRSNSEVQLIEVYRGPQSEWPTPWVDEGVMVVPLSTLPSITPYPADNLGSAAKHELGKILFFERRLSRSEQIACASCHDPDLGWSDGRRLAIGHNRQVGDTKSPTIVNVAYLQELFWDGRASSLEEQVLASLSDPREMAADPDRAAARIASIEGYSSLFVEAFGDSKVSADRIAAAVATFMRSLRFTNTPFDRFMAGDREQLSESQIRGLHLFRTEARCMNCHHGPLLSDERYHHLGTSFHNVGNFKGRYRVTGKSEDVGAFRTAPLRGVASNPPFTHIGMAPNLDTLIRLYEMGWWQNADLAKKGNDIPTAQLSPLIQPLSLSDQDRADLEAFLKALDGPMPYYTPPKELPW